MTGAARECIDVFPNPMQPGEYLYVPRTADLQRGADGRPLVSLISTPFAKYLMLTAEWRADDAELDRLRHELAARDGLGDPDAIRLSFAPVAIEGCRLLLSTSAPDSEQLAFSSTSHVPPFSALFNVSLDEAQFELASAALRGAEGVLAVEYRGTLGTPIEVRGSLASDSPRLRDFLLSFQMAEQGERRAAIESAVRDGLARVVLELPDGADAELVSLVYDRVIGRAAELLPRWLELTRGITTAAFDVSVEFVRDVRVPVSARTDLGTISAPGHVNASTA